MFTRLRLPAVALLALPLTASQCHYDTAETPPAATTTAPSPKASVPSKARREAECERKLRASFRLALTDPDDADEADPPVPPVCWTLPRADRKRIASKVIFSELGEPCPAERFPDDCEAAKR